MTTLRRSALAGLLMLAPLAAAPARAAEDRLLATPQTVQMGHFDAAIPPVLRIKSGDIVDMQTMTMINPTAIDASGAVPRAVVPDYVRAVFDQVKAPANSHVLTGPISVEGAEPGDVLEVRILKVALAVDYGYNIQVPHAGVLPEDFPALWQRVIPIDRRARTAVVAPGVVVPLDHPFFGIMGVAPRPALGRISTTAPGVYAGNFDNKDLAEEAILYIPVQAPGALFSAGDGHGAQGDGEADLAAIETGLEGRFQFILHKHQALAFPRAETKGAWIAIGIGPTLDEAMKMAVRDTIAQITERFPSLSRQEAYLIASVAVDYHVTQAVDHQLGVHGVIPKAIFKNAAAR